MHEGDEFFFLGYFFGFYPPKPTFFLAGSLMSELWFKCQDCGSNVRIVVQMSELWFGAISGLGMGWMVGWDLCAGLFYEYRFAMLTIEQ